MANLKFKVEALRTLASPYRKGDKDESTFETIYYLLVDMKELPSNIPLDVNPREPKMTTNVARSLLTAVVEPETDFYINNRGIVIAAKTLTFNSTDSEVTIDIGDQTAATPIPPSCVSATKFLKTFENLFVLKSSPMCRISRASPMLATRRFRFPIWHYSISTTSSTILKPPLQVRHMQI